MAPACRCPPIASTPPSPYTSANASADIKVSEFMNVDCNIDDLHADLAHPIRPRRELARTRAAGCRTASPAWRREPRTVRSSGCSWSRCSWRSPGSTAAIVRPIRRAGSRNSGVSSNDSTVICQEMVSITTSVSVSVTRFDTTPESVSENARCAPMTSLPSLLTSAPVRVRVKNATGIRWTWSNTAVRRSRISPSPMVDDNHRVTSAMAASADAPPRRSPGRSRRRCAPGRRARSRPRHGRPAPVWPPRAVRSAR